MWFGNIGFFTTVDKGDGVYETEIIEKQYYADILRVNRRYSQENINTDINMSVQLRILSDDYVNQHISDIAYVDYMGAKWRVTDIDPLNYPRVTLTLGGLYNE